MQFSATYLKMFCDTEDSQNKDNKNDIKYRKPDL